MNRTTKLNAVRALANALVASHATMTFAQLAAHLNLQGIKTCYGTPYHSGGRGVARLAHAAYLYVRDELGLGAAAAEPIAKAFTNQNGYYAYD